MLSEANVIRVVHYFKRVASVLMGGNESKETNCSSWFQRQIQEDKKKSEGQVKVP